MKIDKERNRIVLGVSSHDGYYLAASDEGLEMHNKVHLSLKEFTILNELMFLYQTNKNIKVRVNAMVDYQFRRTKENPRDNKK